MIMAAQINDIASPIVTVTSFLKSDKKKKYGWKISNDDFHKKALLKMYQKP